MKNNKGPQVPEKGGAKPGLKKKVSMKGTKKPKTSSKDIKRMTRGSMGGKLKPVLGDAAKIWKPFGM